MDINIILSFQVLVELLAKGGSVKALIEEKGLVQVSDVLQALHGYFNVDMCSAIES
jgi:hypothetical protein